MDYGLESLCFEYIYCVKDLENIGTKGLYSADKIRSMVHDRLCAGFGIKKEDTTHITDNLDKINYDGMELYYKLLDLSRNQ